MRHAKLEINDFRDFTARVQMASFVSDGFIPKFLFFYYDVHEEKPSYIVRSDNKKYCFKDLRQAIQLYNLL